MIEDGVKEGKIHLYPCTTTLELMSFMVKKEQLREICEEPLGAAKFLELCDDADAVISL